VTGGVERGGGADGTIVSTEAHFLSLSKGTAFELERVNRANNGVVLRADHRPFRGGEYPLGPSELERGPFTAVTRNRSSPGSALGRRQIKDGGAPTEARYGATVPSQNAGGEKIGQESTWTKR